MPNFRGHIIGASLLYPLIVWRFLPPQTPSMFAEWYICMLAGALFPDIDTNSKGQQFFYAMMLCLFLYFILHQNAFGLMCVSSLAIFPLLTKHRGITHSLLFLMVLCLAPVIYLQNYMPRHAYILSHDILFFFFGALSHIGLDRMSTKLKRYKILR